MNVDDLGEERGGWSTKGHENGKIGRTKTRANQRTINIRPALVKKSLPLLLHKLSWAEKSGWRRDRGHVDSVDEFGGGAEVCC